MLVNAITGRSMNCDCIVCRIVKDNPLSEKNKARCKEYYRSNKEYFRQYYKRYYIKNREKLLAKRREYRLKNKDKINAYARRRYHRVY